MKLSELYAQLGAELIKGGDREVSFNMTANLKYQSPYIELEGFPVEGSGYNSPTYRAQPIIRRSWSLSPSTHEVRIYLT
jgi:hypothetical protein